MGADFIQDVLLLSFAADSGGRSSNSQPNRLSSSNVGSKDSSGANRRTPRQSSRWSVCSEVSPASGDKSLSCLHPERSSDWSEVRLASGTTSLSCSHSGRWSVWSEVRPAGGLKSRELFALGEVERLERSQAGQRGQCR